jgi:hypothetical protein
MRKAPQDNQLIQSTVSAVDVERRDSERSLFSSEMPEKCLMVSTVLI